LMPVEILGRVGTGGHAETAPNTSLPDLGNDSFRVAIGRIDRTDLHTRRVVTVKAGAGNEPGSYLGIFSFRFANHLQPADDSPPVGLLLSNKASLPLTLS
jgi:hypothetical protein